MAKIMKPVRFEDGFILVAANSEMISEMHDATPKEKKHIVRCINDHEALLAKIKSLKKENKALRGAISPKKDHEITLPISFQEDSCLIDGEGGYIGKIEGATQSERAYILECLNGYARMKDKAEGAVKRLQTARKKLEAHRGGN